MICCIVSTYLPTARIVKLVFFSASPMCSREVNWYMMLFQCYVMWCKIIVLDHQSFIHSCQLSQQQQTVTLPRANADIRSAFSCLIWILSCLAMLTNYYYYYYSSLIELIHVGSILDRNFTSWNQRVSWYLVGCSFFKGFELFPH